MEVLRTRPDKEFVVPNGVEAHLVDTISGYPEHDGFPARSEYFMKGTLPTGDDPIHTKLDVCKSDGKLAREIDIAKDDSEEKEFIILREDDPLTGGGVNKWQEGIDAWIAGIDDQRYRPPTEFCEGNTDLVTNITSPGDKSRINSNDVEVTVKVAASGDVDWVKIFVDGEEREKLNESPFKTTLTLEDGSYTLQARARQENGEERDSGEVRIGVNQDWDEEIDP